ncbi:MAG: DinB family protein [Anditalea sp.]
MKKVSLVVAALVLISFTARETNIPNSNNTGNVDVYQNSNDKEFLLDYFQKANDRLKKSIGGFGETQMRFKPSTEQWSVSQCLEHIILTEQMLFEMTKELLAKPANPERKEEVKITDQELIDGMTDRSSKATAPKELQPEGKYDSPETALKDLKDQRAEIIDFIKKTAEEDLRNHITDSPFGPVDAYHSLLYIAAHTARHTLQIEEVMADTGFPSK